MNERSHEARTLLLVDDEPNIINALKRTFRREGYLILTANSGAEGLAILAEHDVHVILSDQRMPEMTGVEFLRNVKNLYPKTIRIALSGYTDLESITSAINEGAIYKFLTKPWDDEQLRDNVRKSFAYYEMESENLRLSTDLQKVNEQLSILNQNLEQKVLEKSREINLNMHLLQISQEILEHLPVGVLGVDEQGMIALSNRQADALLHNINGESLLGADIMQYLPPELLNCVDASDSHVHEGGIFELPNGTTLQVTISPMGLSSRSNGKIIVISTHHRSSP